MSGPIQLIATATGDDFLPVLNEQMQGLLKRQQARLTIYQSQHVHAKGLLHRRKLKELLENLTRLHGPRQLHGNAHTLAIALITQVSDTLDFTIAHQLGDAFDEVSLIGLIRKLGDDNGFRLRDISSMCALACTVKRPRPTA